MRMNKMRSIIKMNKRGQILNAVGGTVIGVVTLIFLVFAGLYGIAILNPSSFFTDAANRNATLNLQGNLTEGVSVFSGNIPVVFKILGAVLALGAILLLIAFVGRMRQQSGGSGAGSL